MTAILYSEIMHLMQYDNRYHRFMVDRDVQKWLQDTGIIDRMGEDCFVLADKTHQYGLWFDCSEDAAAFKLTWM